MHGAGFLLQRRDRNLPRMEPNLLDGGQNLILCAHSAQRRIDEAHPLRAIVGLAKSCSQLEQQAAMRALSLALEGKGKALGVCQRGELHEIERLFFIGVRRIGRDEAQLHLVRFFAGQVEPVAMIRRETMPRVEERIGWRFGDLCTQKRSDGDHGNDEDASQSEAPARSRSGVEFVY
jgi:hypothetical protein